MIQDIYPSKLNIEYIPVEPRDNDPVLVFDKDGKILVRESNRQISFPTAASAAGHHLRFLFSIDDRRYYLGAGDELEGFVTEYDYLTIRQVRDVAEGSEVFAAFTAYHLNRWYTGNRYCGSCGGVMSDEGKERALRCEKCGRIIYPRINPAVIVGVINGDTILITRYQRGYSHNALIAGFVEIGETLEQTVAREVMEEAGIRVKNIRYYKSQPWGMAEDLLVGFYCDADGDTNIRMDENELKYAAWTKREDIELQPGNLSLTNEMMRMFKENRV